jgi:hypothetical protein
MLGEINKNDIMLKILTNKKCKKVQKNKSVTYEFDGLKIKVHRRVGDKIDNFIKSKRYKMLSDFIDIYSSMFTTNFV